MKVGAKCVISLVVLVLLSFSSAFAAGVLASLLNQYPDPARAGDVLEVRVRLTNQVGGDTGEIRVEALPEYPFALLPGSSSEQVISSLPSYPAEASSKVVTFKFLVDSGARDGTYKAKFRHSTDSGASWVTYEFDVYITAVEFAEISSISPTKLMPGEETNLTFTITNKGNAPLQNAVFSWSEETGVVLPVGSSNTRYIKYLGAGQSVDLSYIAMAGVEANPDLYKLSLSLTYDLVGSDGVVSTSVVSTQAGIFVGGGTDFDVTFSESSQGTTSLSVANIGGNRALSVTVKVPQQENFLVTGSSSAIIGNLDKGDYTIVSFQISPAGRALKGANTLKVVIEYTDTTGVRRSVEKDVAIEFRSGSSSTTTSTTQNGFPARSNGLSLASIASNPLLIGAVVVLVISSITAWWFFRKKTPVVEAKKSPLVQAKEKLMR